MRTYRSLYVFVVFGERVDVEGYEETVKEVVGQNLIQGVYVQTQDIVKVMKVIQVLGNQVGKAISTVVTVTMEIG